VGLAWEVPREARLAYYGRGPHENYPDRNRGCGATTPTTTAKPWPFTQLSTCAACACACGVRRVRAACACACAGCRAKVGVYEQAAEDFFEPYVFPQDSGLRTDVRWLALRSPTTDSIDCAAAGLLVSGLPTRADSDCPPPPPHFQFSASPYSAQGAARRACMRACVCGSACRVACCVLCRVRRSNKWFDDQMWQRRIIRRS
jgi:hypothetical protein